MTDHAGSPTWYSVTFQVLRLRGHGSVWLSSPSTSLKARQFYKLYLQVFLEWTTLSCKFLDSQEVKCFHRLLSFPHRCQEGFLGEYCQHRDPCEKNRCQNGGTCVAQAMLGKATCRCALGFTGEDCQYSTTHPCFVSHPCLNGGTCHVLSRDAYECTCQVGFTGNKWDSGPYFSIFSRYLYLASFRSWHLALKGSPILVHV